MDVAFKNSRGNNLSGIITEATNNIQDLVIMVHGFSSSKNTQKFVSITDEIVKGNISSLRFDVYGHGDSDGDFADITVTEAVDDIIQAIGYVKSLGYKRIGLIGSSFGGNASILAASQNSDLTFLGLVCPVSNYSALEHYRKSAQELEAWKENGYRIYVSGDGTEHRVNYSFFEDIQQYDEYKLAEKISVPTLVVHGNADTIVPYTQSEELIKHIPQSELKIVQGAGHRFENEDQFQEMCQYLVEFTLTYLGNKS